MKKLHLTSNPCRVYYAAQEIVVYRDTLMARLRQSAVLQPKLRQGSEYDNLAGDDIELSFSSMAHSILAQATLSPLPVRNRPIIWNQDHCFRLYPIPDVVVQADPSIPTLAKQLKADEDDNRGCWVCNPSGWADGRQWRFWVYFPAKRTMQLSALGQSGTTVTINTSTS